MTKAVLMFTSFVSYGVDRMAANESPHALCLCGKSCFSLSDKQRDNECDQRQDEGTTADGDDVCSGTR